MITSEDHVLFENAHGTIRRQVPRVVTIKNLNDSGQRPTQQPWKSGLHSLQAFVSQTANAGQRDRKSVV